MPKRVRNSPEGESAINFSIVEQIIAKSLQWRLSGAHRGGHSRLPRLRRRPRTAPAPFLILSGISMANKYDHLTKDELARLLEARDRRDATRFGLVWEANEIERDKAINSDFVALDLVPEHSVGAASWRNLIIEGDNFDALRYLRMTYAGRVKCILIDPPYNTGKKDFVYNDRFVD